MDFALTEAEQAVQELARQILGGRVTPDRLKEIEATEERFDRDTWTELAKANLLGVALPEDAGGSGLGFLAACVLLEEIGRTVAPLPVLATIVMGALPVAELGTRAQRERLLPPVIAGYLAASDRGDAEAVVRCFAEDAVVVDEGQEWRGTAAIRRWRATVATAYNYTVQVTGAKAVGQRAADAYIDTEAVRLTAWQAAWRLHEGLPATEQVAIAKFWAADGGQRVVHAAQHLHGGMGVDRDYPLHRYYLWAKWLQLALGGASQHLLKLGQILANEPV